LKPYYQNFIISIVALFVLSQTVASAAIVVPAAPRIVSTSHLVQDFQSGRILVEEDIDVRVEPASLTKIMTVYIVASELAEENIHLDDMVEVSEKAWRMEGSRMFIEVNKKVSVSDLLNGVIIQSGNDASIALSEYIAGSEEVFVEVMNQHAARLGMTNTHFMNSTGLPHEEHYTTARDMATLTRAMIRDFPDIYAWHKIKEFTFNDIKQYNRNKMLWRDDSVDGVKTGHTESAGYCLVASSVRGDMRLISVVMGTNNDESRTRSTQSIMSYGFRFFETHKLFAANEVISQSRVWKGVTENIDLGINEDLYITIPRGKLKKLDTIVELDDTIIAPVTMGDVQGNVRIVLEGEDLTSRPLLALRTINQGSFFNRLKDEIKLLFE